jgi:hypothetical protein
MPTRIALTVTVQQSVIKTPIDHLFAALSVVFRALGGRGVRVVGRRECDPLNSA